MFNIQPMTNLYTGAQGYFDRAQRAWEAACAAWNKVPDVPKRLPVGSPEAIINHRDKATVHAEWVDVPACLMTRLCIQPEIIINHRDKAIIRADCASAKPTSASRLILWTDATVKKNTEAGWAVAFWDGLNWVRITARGPTATEKRKPEINITELQAIGLALDYAVQLVERKTEIPLQILEVYTDSQGALMLLRDAKRDLLNPKISKLLRKSIQTRMVVRNVSLQIKKLEEAGVHTEFRWVPRSTTLGNMLADKGAKLARLTSDGYYTLNNALVEIMPSHTDEIKYKSGCLPLAYTREFIQQSCMAEHIASILGNREKSVEDKSMEDIPEETQEDTQKEIREESQEGSQDVSIEDAPGESLENSPGKHPEGTPEEILESSEESQAANLNLDLLYDAPAVEVDMKEVIPIDPDLWQLYGESL